MPLKLEKGVRSLKLKFQDNVSHLTLVLGAKSRCSCRATVEPFFQAEIMTY